MVEVGDGAKRAVHRYAEALEMLAQDDREFGPVPQAIRDEVRARMDAAGIVDEYSDDLKRLAEED